MCSSKFQNAITLKFFIKGEISCRLAVGVAHVERITPILISETYICSYEGASMIILSRLYAI